MMSQPNIAFAGLTAAGKTTHARLLAEHLGYSYVSATEALLGILDIDAPGDQVWFERYEQIQAARTGGGVDDELDRRLALLAATSTATVFDTWALAWVGPGPMVRVWIESDPASRARKCLVSQTRPRLSLDRCAELVREKDADTRARFVVRHGFDLFTDRARYDLIVCNSHLIDEPTSRGARAGIEAFAPVVHATVTALLAGASADELAELAARHPREVLRIRRLPEPGRCEAMTPPVVRRPVSPPA